METKTAIIIVIVAILFFFVGAMFTSLKIRSSEIQGLANWKKLKQIDDRGLKNAGELSLLCQQSIEAYVAGNVQEIKNTQIKVQSVAQDTAELANERQAILKKLGY